jgi:hypothetical protein
MFQGELAPCLSNLSLWGRLMMMCSTKSTKESTTSSAQCSETQSFTELTLPTMRMPNEDGETSIQRASKGCCATRRGSLASPRCCPTPFSEWSIWPRGRPSPQHNSENLTLSLIYAEFDAAVITSTISRQAVAAAFYCPVLADQGQRIGAAITLHIQHSRINPRTNECFANSICTPL